MYENIAYIALTAEIDIGDLSRWQVFVSTGYIRLIQARNPPALIILAYYAVAMTTVRAAWYTQNWAEYTLRGIRQDLPGPMQEYIQWPLEQVQTRLNELGVRSPDSTHSECSMVATA